MGMFAQRATIGVGSVALAAGCSMLFGGTAFAGSNHYNSGNNNTAGAGGDGGTSSAECGTPFGATVGAIAGQGGNISQCNANGGNGGNGGNADY